MVASFSTSSSPTHTTKISSQIAQTNETKPLRVVVYGVEGVGKSTFASGAPSPIFLCAEEGINHLEIERFPVIRNWVEVLEAIRILTHEDHPYKTLVIDTLDWLEPLCRDHVCKLAGVPHLDAIAHGSGLTEVVQQWRNLLSDLEMLVCSRKMSVILIGHAMMKRVEGLHGSHDRYQLKLHERVVELLRGWSDLFLFARPERVILERRVTPPNPPEVRLLHTENTGRWEANNRYGLPATMPLDWSEIVHFVQKYRPTHVASLQAELVTLIPYLQESARAAQVMRDWAGNDPWKLFQLLERVRSKLVLEAAG